MSQERNMLSNMLMLKRKSTLLVIGTILGDIVTNF